MCRLLDVESLKLLCTLHKIDVPDCIDNLIGPHPNMNGRKCNNNNNVTAVLVIIVIVVIIVVDIVFIVVIIVVVVVVVV